MSKAEWVIDSDGSIERQQRQQLGNAEYSKRIEIANRIADQYPESQWEEQIIMRPQFESIALQVSEALLYGAEGKVGLAERDHDFWARLVFKLIARLWQKEGRG